MMNNLSIGDLSQTFLFQRRSVALRSELTQLADELATGQIRDVRAAMNGNYSYLSDLEHEMRIADAFSIAGAEATQFSEGVQNALERFQTANADLADSLLRIADSPASPVASQGASIARGQLDLMFSALNSDVAGRNLFSGTATDVNALSDVETFLTALEGAVAGAATAADLETAARNWFNDPAGFEALVYQGADTFVSPFKLSKDEGVSFDLRADDEVFREVLLHSGLSALTDSATLGLDNATIKEVHGQTSFALLASSDAVVGLRARVGTIEERIDQLKARNAAEATALDFARRELLEADPFDVANRLEGVRFQLDSLYAVTARLSDLSLVNYIR